MVVFSYFSWYLPAGKRKAEVILGQPNSLPQIEDSSETGHGIIVCILLMNLFISFISRLAFSTANYLPALTVVSEK